MAKKPFHPILNIKNELANADKRNFNFFRDLVPEDQKRLVPYPILRWMSITQRNDPGFSEYYITAVNDIANVGFWDLYKHPSLQWQLIAACGLGRPTSHGWISGPKRGASSKIEKLIETLKPEYNRQEVSLAARNITKEELYNLCRSFGWEEEEIKPYLKELKSRT